MSERLDLAFREAEGPTPNPPDLLTELRDLVLQIFPHATDSGLRWIRGRGDQELAKAAEIRASALEKLGRLELERQKLLQERDKALLDAGVQDKRDQAAHRERMYELKSQRLREVIEAVKAVQATGAKLNAKTVNRIGELLISSLEEEG